MHWTPILSIEFFCYVEHCLHDRAFADANAFVLLEIQVVRCVKPTTSDDIT